eukprot:3266303-Pleurochrysis_carterae.AAC.1
MRVSLSSVNPRGRKVSIKARWTSAVSAFASRNEAKTPKRPRAPYMSCTFPSAASLQALRDHAWGPSADRESSSSCG